MTSPGRLRTRGETGTCSSSPSLHSPEPCDLSAWAVPWPRAPRPRPVLPLQTFLGRPPLAGEREDERNPAHVTIHPSQSQGSPVWKTRPPSGSSWEPQAQRLHRPSGPAHALLPEAAAPACRLDRPPSSGLRREPLPPAQLVTVTPQPSGTSSGSPNSQEE